MFNQILNPETYQLNLLSVCTCLIGSIIILVGFLILFLEKKSFVSIVNLMTTFSVFLWLLGYTFIYASQNPDVALWWFKYVSAFGFPFIPPLICMLKLVITKKFKKYHLLTYYFLFIALVSSCTFAFTDIFVKSVYLYPWGYYPKFEVPAILYFLAFYAIVITYFCHLLIRDYRLAPKNIQKLRQRMLLNVFAIGILGNIDFLGNLGIPVFPLGFLPIFISTLLLAYTFHRYRFVDLTPAAIVDQIVLTMNDLLIVTDTEFRVVFVNQATCHVLGYQTDEIINRPVSTFFASPQDTHQLHDLHEHDLVRRKEIKFLAKNKKEIYFDLSISPLISRFNDKEGIVFILRDVTDRKKTDDDLKAAYEKLKASQTQLIQSEKMASLGQLAAGVAHEINNPTAFIRSNLQLYQQYNNHLVDLNRNYRKFIEDHIPADDHRAQAYQAAFKEIDNDKVENLASDTREIIEESIEGTERITNIVQNLKNFVNPDGGEYVLTDIHKELESSLNLVWNRIKSKCEIVKSYQSDLPRIYVKAKQMTQVFVNLFINAAQAIPAKGTISIKTYQKNQSVYIEIADTGRGIAKENIEKIFNPFFTTKEIGQGTGLGLYLAYDIIKNHKGDILVQSVLDQGTTFIINLPFKPMQSKKS